MAIGAELLRLRTASGVSAADVANSLGINIDTYRKWEYHPERKPRGKDLKKILDFLKVPDEESVQNLQSLPPLKETGEEMSYSKAVVVNPPKRVPFYDAPADASNVDGDMLPVSQPTGYIATGDLFGSTCEAVIRIRGASMAKSYPAGSVLGLIRDYDSFLLTGEVYVMETRSKRVFKRVYEDEERPGFWECYSDNAEIYTEGQRIGKPVYPHIYIPKEEVIRRWSVVGSAREEGNSILIHADPN